MSTQVEQQTTMQNTIKIELSAEQIYQLATSSTSDYSFVELMTKAADSGNFLAIYALGHYYLGRNGNPQDFKKSLMYFDKIVHGHKIYKEPHALWQRTYSFVMKEYLEEKLNIKQGIIVIHEPRHTVAFSLAIRDIVIQEKNGSNAAHYSETWGYRQSNKTSFSSDQYHGYTI
jgi:hypothetical protein